MVTKRSDGVRGSQERSVRRKCWQVPLRLMEGRSGSVNSVPIPVCGRDGGEGVVATTSRQDGGGKYRQAVAARTGEGSTGPSSSSGEEDKKYTSQEAEIKELRAQVERFRRERGEAGQDGPSESVRKESVVEEDW